MAFWGVEVKPGEPYVLEPSGGGRLRICQATLGSYGDVGWSTLECNVGNSKPVKLCALNPTNVLTRLKLEFEETENVVLSVLGNSSIHLSGSYICSHEGDHEQYIEKHTIKPTSPTCLKVNHQGDEADGNNDVYLKEPIVNEEGDNANGTNDASPKAPIVSEADGKDDVRLKEAIVSEADFQNDVALEEAIVNEADGKNRVTPKEAIVSKDGDDDDEHLPLSKRRASYKRKCKIPQEEQMLSDQNNDVTQVNERKDSKSMDSNAAYIVPLHKSEMTHEGRVLQPPVYKKSSLRTEGNSDAASDISGQSYPIITDFLFTGAAELQCVKKQDKDAENCESVHARECPVRKQILDKGMIIEDLVEGRAKARKASNGRKVTVKYAARLRDEQTDKPMDNSIIHKFKIGAGEVILGLDDGVSGMRVGGKRRLTIPLALGFGNEAVGIIPADSWLIYEVELTKVKKVKRSKNESQAYVNP